MASTKNLKDLLSQSHISNGDVRYMGELTKKEIFDSTPNCHGKIRERLYWLQHGLIQYPSCGTCSNTLSSKNFRTNISGGGYTLTCSVRCAKRNPVFAQAQQHVSLQKYGTRHFLACVGARAAIHQTNIQRYGSGCPHPWGSPKFKELMVDKHGVDHSSNIVESRARSRRQLIEQNILAGKTLASIRANETRQNAVCVDTGPALDLNRDVLENVELSWRHLTCERVYSSYIIDGLITTCPHCTRSASMLELSLRAMVAELLPNEQLIFNARDVLPGGKELDIWIPGRQLALEFNGIYWHSSLKQPDKFYHLIKSEACRALGIRLLHIWEDQFLQRQAVVRSVIANACGRSQRIGGRLSSVQTISSAAANKFLDQNHLAGHVRGTVNLALVYQEQIVAVMSFGRQRFAKTSPGHWEIYRFASLAGTQVQGGAHKLFQAFLQQYSPDSVAAFADASLGGGDVYLKIGMIEQPRTLPAYFWANTQFPNRLSRFRTQKHKLQQLLGDEYDEGLSEEANMKRLGWFKLWDCGSRKFQWCKTDQTT